MVKCAKLDQKPAPGCVNRLCAMRKEILDLQAENLHLIRRELIELKLNHVDALLEVKRLREA